MVLTMLLFGIYSFLAQAGVYVEPTPEPEFPTAFDSNSPQSFNYVSGDYSTINDWSQVDWSQIPAARIEDVPPDKLDYSALNPVQRQKMSPDQISANFEEIDDIRNDVYYRHAELAIKSAYGIEVLLYGSAQIRNGKLQSTPGAEMPGEATLSNEMYKKGAFTVFGDGQIYFKLDPTISEVSVPPSDDVVVNSKNIVKYQNHKFLGEIHFIKSYLSVKNFAYFDNIMISTYSEQKELPLFFDSLPHEGYYISLDQEKGTMTSNIDFARVQMTT